MGDNVRAASGGITINGSIGDDLMVMGGGAVHGGFVYPVTAGGHNVQQGIYLNGEIYPAPT